MSVSEIIIIFTATTLFVLIGAVMFFVKHYNKRLEERKKAKKEIMEQVFKRSENGQ